MSISLKDKVEIGELVLKGDTEAAVALAEQLKKSAVDTATLLGGSRSAEATRLAEQSQGKIVLRINAKGEGVVDFPELGIKGMGRLSVAGPTDLNNGLVQGEYVDIYGNIGVPGISYITGVRAMQEATKQGKKLLPADSAAAKMQALFATLGTSGTEQTKVFQALFGADFSGYWFQNYERWYNAGSTWCFGASEVDTDGNVRTFIFNASNAPLNWNGLDYPQAFFAFEDC